MASEHSAIAAARSARGQGYGVLQCTIRATDSQGVPLTGPDDPSAVLSAIAEIGYDVVAMSLTTYPGPKSITCVYVFRWAGR
jgi:hypothetical protein